MKLGSNQLIACIAYGIVLLGSVPMVLFTAPEQASTWLDWSIVFVPVAVGSILGGSAIVKSAQALAKGKKA